MTTFPITSLFSTELAKASIARFRRDIYGMKEELPRCSGQLATDVTEFLTYQQKPPRQTPIDTVDRTMHR